jgi:glucose-6-phosphate dehydrogenase assembly protein OpcA
MPTNYKVLGQVAPTNTSDANLYTVPASTQAVVSTIAVTNDTAVAATFRIYVRVAGATASATNALYFDAPLAANSTLLATAGITLGAGDILTVQTGTANALGFQAFGSEVTP